MRRTSKDTEDLQIATPDLKPLLKRISDLQSRAIDCVKSFLGDERLGNVAEQYQAHVSRVGTDLGFNLFSIVSDLYYRENFHSDILRALLDPASPHGEGNKFLRLFLQLLAESGARIDPGNYRHATVAREQGKVDLLILDAESKRAIIIENKMNNAGDMPQQLPRYLDYVRGRGFTCDTIVYLRLNRKQRPNEHDWTPQESADVNALLCCITAFSEAQKDLYHGWFIPCETLAHNPDAKHIFRQYAALVRKLGENIMNKVIMEEFFSLMLESGNFKAAQSASSMLNDLVLYRVERIIDAFSRDLHPFKNLNNYRNEDAYFTNLIWKGAHLGLDVWVEPDRYVLEFWDRNDPENKHRRALTALEKAGLTDQFTVGLRGFHRTLLFPDHEPELFALIRHVKARLSEALVEPTH